MWSQRILNEREAWVVVSLVWYLVAFCKEHWMLVMVVGWLPSLHLESVIKSFT